MTSQQELLTQWREYFDEALRNVGVRAPLPRADQSSNDYVRETCRTLKRRYLPQNHEFARINFRGLEADVLQRLAPQLIEHVKVEAVNPNNLEPGEMRMVVKRDINGVEKRDWIGRQSFVRDMMQPGRRVVSFTTDRGRYDAAKARWF